jgi:hypothetical protein
VQLDDVAVRHDVIRADMLSLESRVAPYARIAYRVLEVAMD